MEEGITENLNKNSEEEEIEVCKNCDQQRNDDIIFHELYCYDAYIVSAPCPQGDKQKVIDNFLTEKIVKPLEEKGYNCYHGCRNMTGGDFVISAISNPVVFIPTTIVPIYKDREFASLLNFLLKPDYLKRIVFLLFDSSKPDPPGLLRNCFSISKNDIHLLPKLEATINRNKNIFPLHKRKALFEMETDPESTISSVGSQFLRNTSFRRSDISRRSFRRKNKQTCPQPSEYTPSSASDFSRYNLLRRSIQQDISSYVLQCSGIFMHDIKDMTSPNELLRYFDCSDKRIQHFAAKTLTQVIKKDIMKFSDNVNLQIFEKQARFLLEHDNTRNGKIDSDFKKLYCWILAAIYIRICQGNDANLKAYMRSLPLIKYKVKHEPVDKVRRKTYHELMTSLCGKLQNSWSNQLNDNKYHIRKLESCLSIVERIASPEDVNTEEATEMITYLKNLPWDIRHIFLVIITEKIFDKNLMDYSMPHLLHICTCLESKHSEIVLDVVERATQHIQDNYTEDTVHSCLILLVNIWDRLKISKKKNGKLLTVIKQYFQRLVYHPLKDVQNYIIPLLFIKECKSFDICHLGSSCLPVDDHLVETCIREKLSNDYPDMTIKEQVQTAKHTLIYKAKTPDGEALVYVFKQRTLNDILQTNSTDDALESFQEMSRAVKLCQGSDSIVSLRTIPSNCTLPFFVVEHGTPLLHFLHTNQNQLKWVQIIEILIDITKAVQHCHEQSVVLRDITPASFVVIHKKDKTFRVKLSSFLCAKCIQYEGAENRVWTYVEDINLLSFQGDSTEPVAAYFSAPETLQSNSFSKYTESWMLAATFYSVLLYGRCPFQELTHLSVSQFVKEIISDHKAEIPISLPPDLWKILEVNLRFEASNRMSTEKLLEELEKYKNNLGINKHTLHNVTSICRCISPKDIQQNYININANFIQEETKEIPFGCYIDDVTEWTHCLNEKVSVRINLNTRRGIQGLCHENVLRVKEIRNDSYTTTLISYPFRSRVCTLDCINSNTDRDKLLSYFVQTAHALQYLHSKNILHCDLRASHVYVNEVKGVVKVGHFGRAVSLEGKQTHPYAIKMMPSDAEKWSAPEVRANGIYSRASDIFNLAVVFLEALSTQENPIYENCSFRSFARCCNQMEVYAECVSDVQGDCFHELIKCLQKCWHPNPTKRPSLDYIVETIQRLRTIDGKEMSEQNNLTESDEEYEDKECHYETIMYYSPSEFSRNSAWEYVVNEFELSNGFQRVTTSFTNFTTTSDYQDVGIQRKRSKRTMGFIL
ncbi:uncharacterized protein O3C94_017448 [Discoglossus pictus]